MKLLTVLIILLYAINIKADSTAAENLIKKYGKEAIMKEIARKVGNKFTIYIDNQTRLAPAPSAEFVTSWTLSADIERAGMSVQSMEKILLDRQAKTKAKDDRLAGEQQSRREALEKLRLDQHKYRAEDIKFFAEASEEEREIFRQARFRGLQQKLNREEPNITPEQPIHRQYESEIQKRKTACQLDDYCSAKEAFTAEAQVNCQRGIERMAKYRFEWTDRWTQPKFNRFKWADSTKTRVQAVGNYINLENGFGAWQPHIYLCEVRISDDNIVDIKMEPGRL